MSITSNAVGRDCFIHNMILPILDKNLPVTSHILNYSISVKTFPNAWKKVQVHSSSLTLKGSFLCPKNVGYVVILISLPSLSVLPFFQSPRVPH